MELVEQGNKVRFIEFYRFYVTVRPTTRYETIEVEYLDIHFKKQKQVFKGFPAQIIQHEMDHFEGIII